MFNTVTAIIRTLLISVYATCATYLANARMWNPTQILVQIDQECFDLIWSVACRVIAPGTFATLDELVLKRR